MIGERAATPLLVRPIVAHPNSPIGLLDVQVGVIDGAARLTVLRSRPPLRSFSLRPTRNCAISPLPDLDQTPAAIATEYDASPRPRLDLMLASVGPGVLANDRWITRIRATNGAHTCITSQGATRVHRAVGDATARLNLTLVADAGAIVDYQPEPTILFAGSALDQRVRLRQAGGAAILFREVIVPGRLASGEAFCLRHLRSRLEAFHDGRLVCADYLALGERIATEASAIGRFGPRPVIGTFVVLVDRSWTARVATAIVAVLAPPADVLTGVTHLPNDAGVWCRAIGPTAATVQSALELARSAAASALGLPS